jgi:hypothetical protein
LFGSGNRWQRGGNLVKKRLAIALFLSTILATLVVVFMLAGLTADFSNFSVDHAHNVMIHHQATAAAIVVDRISEPKLRIRHDVTLSQVWGVVIQRNYCIVREDRSKAIS